MMRKRFLSLTCALALCLGLLPVTALAAAPDRQVIYVGNENVTSGGYWTTDSNGSVTAYTEDGTTPSNNYIHYNKETNTLTLHNATIKESLDYTDSNGDSSFIHSSAIGVLNQQGNAELTIQLEGSNTIAGVGKGIYVLAHSQSTGSSRLTIMGNGSLDTSSRQTGIWVQSNSNNAALSIENAKVTATVVDGYGGNGVFVQSSENSSVSLTVNSGSLTATGSGEIYAGIKLQFGSGGSGSGSGTPTVTVSGNAVVDAKNGGIANNSSSPIQYETGSDSTGGIVFDGNTGTVYGKVELQEDLEIGEGESLTIGKDASLTVPDGKTLTNKGTVTTDGGTLTNNGTINNSGTLPSNIGGEGVINHAPTITTDSLPNGTEGTSYSETLAAEGTAPITWSIAKDSSLPDGLNLSSDGTITGTPTAQGESKFTVTATNACGSDSQELTITIDAQTNVPVTGVSLNTSTLNLVENETGTLTATVEPSNATNKDVTWESSNTSVATVDATGKVTAIGAGTATITVTTEDGSKTATCAVTVTAATVSVSGVTLNKTALSLTVGDTETLTATITPDNATNKNLTWSSDTPSVASVNNGVVTAVAPGTATITATTVDGGFTATCTVTVRPDIPPANPNYRITVEATQGGTVTADPTAAKAGATVTLTPVPDRGYQVGTVAVTDRFGDAVAVTEQADGTYTFTMPNGQVTVTVTFAEAPLPFPDVTEGDWFYDAVVYAYENGLMDGVGDNLFAPNSQTTRAQLVTILYRLEGQPAVSSDLPFTDVESGTWYTDAILWAAQNNIVNGVNDTEFAPGADITREQLVTILYRYAESKGYDVSASADLSGYPDADQVQDYAQPAMAWAVAEGIVEGVDGTLNPAGNATRAQIATILMRFCEGVAK
ncbi:MAG: S-layer homology domain-containing protein [Evtepia sp.]|nr:S-layer homology domain-containing protein [Evtepia sp.]